MNNILVYVYGTLRQGEINHTRFLRGLEPITTQHIGGFSMYTRGAFPIVVPSDNTNDIVVELYEVSAGTMKNLDRLEGYPHFYNRKIVKTPDGRDAWIYYLERRPHGGDTHIESGDWIEFLDAPQEVA